MDVHNFEDCDDFAAKQYPAVFGGDAADIGYAGGDGLAAYDAGMVGGGDIGGGNATGHAAPIFEAYEQDRMFAWDGTFSAGGGGSEAYDAGFVGSGVIESGYAASGAPYAPAPRPVQTQEIIPNRPSTDLNVHASPWSPPAWMTQELMRNAVRTPVEGNVNENENENENEHDDDQCDDHADHDEYEDEDVLDSDCGSSPAEGEIVEASRAVMLADPYFAKRIRRVIDGTPHEGLVEFIDIDVASREKLYLVRYDDGDCEHLSMAEAAEGVRQMTRMLYSACAS